jgi:parallel beta-helix repeat protein
VGRRSGFAAAAIGLLALAAPSGAAASARLHVRVHGTTASIVLRDSRPAHVRILVDGRVVATGAGRRVTRVIRGLKPGRHVVEARRRHRALARTAFAVALVAAVTEPVGPSAPGPATGVTAEVAAPDGPVAGVVDLQAQASSTGPRIAWVDFLVDGAMAGSATVAPYVVAWNAGSIPAGTHDLVAVAHAADGTTGTSSPVTLVTDGSATYSVDASHYPSLAAAVAALPSSGGSVHVPAGTYAVHDLAIGSNVHLVGDGAGTVLRAPDGSNYTSVLRLAGENISVTDLTIDGNGGAQTGGSGWVVQVRGVSDRVLLRHLVIRAPYRMGVYAWGTYRAVSVQDSQIDGGGTATAGVEYAQGDPTATNSDASVLRSTIRRFKGYGIDFFPWLGGTAYPGPRALAASNTISDITDPSVADGTSEAGIWAGGEDAVIRDNTISRTGWDGIETFGDSKRARLEANTITDTPYGIYLEHETYDSLIQGNTISRVQFGINIEWWYGGKGSKRQTIRGNTITDAAEGISVDVGDDDNLIEGNVITDTTVFGIRLQGASGNVVRNNDLRRSGPQGAVLESIGQTDTGAQARPDRNQITGNDCRGGGGVHLTGSASTASGNLS